MWEGLGKGMGVNIAKNIASNYQRINIFSNMYI